MPKTFYAVNETRFERESNGGTGFLGLFSSMKEARKWALGCAKERIKYLQEDAGSRKKYRIKKGLMVVNVLSAPTKVHTSFTIRLAEVDCFVSKAIC